MYADATVFLPIPMMNRRTPHHAATCHATPHSLLQRVDCFDVELDEIIYVSAKSGIGIEGILPAVIERIPPPPVEDGTILGAGIEGDSGAVAAADSDDARWKKAISKDGDEMLKALLFDSWYDPYRGVINLVEIMSGKLAPGDKISVASTEVSYEVDEVRNNDSCC